MRIPQSELDTTAAGGGHLEVLHWLRIDCPWSQWTRRWMCVFAAEGRHMHVLQWLREHGRVVQVDPSLTAC
jgi:hypothetical protein